MKKTNAPTTVITVETAHPAERIAEARKRVTGVEAKNVADTLVTQMASMQLWKLTPIKGERNCSVVDFLQELQPGNAMESMLAVQMFSVHEAALMFLQRSTLKDQTFDGTDANVNRATRLLRLFNAQLETMQKLKGTAGQQKMTVEHVHVHSGGQAIVGQVDAGKGAPGGDEAKNR